MINLYVYAVECFAERSYQQPLVASRQDDLSSLQRRLETASGRLQVGHLSRILYSFRLVFAGSISFVLVSFCLEQRLSEERARATDASHWSAQDYRAPLDMYSSRAEVYDATVKSPAFLRSSLRERLSTYGLP